MTVALNNLIAKTVDFTLMFTNELRRNTAISITRCVNSYITIISNDGFAADAVTAVTSILACNRMLA